MGHVSGFVSKMLAKDLGRLVRLAGDSHTYCLYMELVGVIMLLRQHFKKKQPPQ
jgi:hypothetical protein